MNEQTNQSTNNLREASIAKSTAELRALFESQIQRLPSGNLDPYRQIIRQANNKPSITYLTPQGILALRKVGVSDIYPDPNLVNVTLRECDMESKNELVIFQDEGSFLERYRRQTPLRRAWEIDLETMYTRLEGDRGGNWELKAVEVLAGERICLRRLIELKLGISPASVSRIFKLLREHGLVEVVQFIEGPGHPVDLLNLTLTGLQHAEKIGLAAKPAPERNATTILQQIVFLQRITIALLERYPESKITRVYGDLSVPKLQTPL